MEPEEVLALAREHYGPIPAEPGVPERIRAQEPPQIAERRLVFEDPRVSQPYITRSYLAPERDAGAQEKAAALVYVAELLGGSNFTSEFGRALQFESDIAVWSSAFYGGVSLDDTTFGMVVVPSEGVSLEEAEAAMDDVIADFMANGPDPEQMESIRTQLRASEIYVRDNVQGLARRYGAALTSGLTVEDVRAWPDILQAVTAEDVLAAAREVLDKRRSVTGWVIPNQEVLSQ